MNHLNAFTAINIVEIVKHKNDDTGKTNDSVVIVDDNNNIFEPNVLQLFNRKLVALLFPCCIAAGCSPFITWTNTDAESEN